MTGERRYFLVSSMAAGLTALGFVAAGLFFPGTPGKSAQLGVLLVGGSSLLALWLKRMALARKSLPAVLGVVVGLFAVRVALVLSGASWAKAHGMSQVAYGAGFFVLYVLLQWVEIGFVVAEAKQPGNGGV